MNNLLLSNSRKGHSVFSLGAGQDSELGFFKIRNKSFQDQYIKTNDLIIIFLTLCLFYYVYLNDLKLIYFRV